MDIDVLFKAEHPKNTYPQHFCYSWASTEVNAACYRRSSSSQGWEQHWPMNISINIQKAVWQHVHIAVTGSPIGSIIPTVIDLGPDLQYHARIPSCGACLDSHQKVVAYPSDLQATIAPVDTSCLAGQYCSICGLLLDNTTDGFSPPASSGESQPLGRKLSDQVQFDSRSCNTI